MKFSVLLYLLVDAQFDADDDDGRSEEQKETEILRMIKNREKQLALGREYITSPKWSNGRLLPPEYEKNEFIDFDPDNMWHLQATLGTWVFND